MIILWPGSIIDSDWGIKGSPDNGIISDKKLPLGRSISVTFLLAIKFSGPIVIDKIEFPVSEYKVEAGEILLSCRMFFNSSVIILSIYF